MPLPNFASRIELFDFLDQYASERKEEIDRWQLERNRGMIKSYVIETAPLNATVQITVPKTFESTGWHLTPIDGEALYQVDGERGKALGYLEPLSYRYLLLHSTLPSTEVDPVVRKGVKASVSLDLMWLASEFFDNWWNSLIIPQMSNRYVRLKFQHEARFERELSDERDEQSADRDLEDDVGERRTSSLMIGDQAGHINRFLPTLRRFDPFKAITMLRMPCRTANRGGYEFWNWGKVTHRAPSFRDGRSQIRSLVDLYSKATEAIERAVWLQTQETKLGDGTATGLRGAPVTLEFDEPLHQNVFHNFVTTTFRRGREPFRLLGNPIKLGDSRVHVYAIDMHLWQEVYLDLSPRRFILFLPSGTCGNTIHRFVTNVQRYLSPGVTTHVGDKAYSELITDIFLGRTPTT